jgi:hypothetical protein
MSGYGFPIAFLAIMVVLSWASIGADYQYMIISEQEVDLIFLAPGDLCSCLEPCPERLMW